MKNVNMSAGLAGYSQLLLHDLSRDLMLISKNTESWRLSMVFLQSFGSAQETIFTWLISPKCHLKKRKCVRSSHLGLFQLSRDGNYPPQVMVKDMVENKSVSSWPGREIREVLPSCSFSHSLFSGIENGAGNERRVELAS